MPRNAYKFYRVPNKKPALCKPNEEIQFFRVGQEIQSTSEPMCVSQMILIAACFSVLLVFVF